MKEFKERTMTIAEAKAFLSQVQEKVENELPEYCTVETFQSHCRKRVDSEGVTVDYSDDYDCAEHTYTYTLSYYVMCHEDNVAAIRQEKVWNGALTSIPFTGNVDEAAAYLLEGLYKDIFTED